MANGLLSFDGVRNTDESIIASKERSPALILLLIARDFVSICERKADP